MKRIHSCLVVVCASLSLVGCVSPNGQPDHTASGALIGGASGAIVGSAVGHHPGPGAAVGAAVGVIAGGLIGHSMDQAQQRRLQTSAPQTWQRVDQGQPLGIEDIKALARAGVSDDLIISQIHSTRTVYHLVTGDIISLKTSGVSEKVIDFMINTPTTANTQPPIPTVVTEPPPQPVTETVVVAQPGPDYIWIDGCWTWYGARWVWFGGHWAVPPRPHARWVVGRWYGNGYSHRSTWHGGHWE
jgi:outer membrane lipoprotein SlyB